LISWLPKLINEIKALRAVAEVAKELTTVTKDYCGATPCEVATDKLISALAKLNEARRG
jgi:hypothetical protein